MFKMKKARRIKAREAINTKTQVFSVYPEAVFSSLKKKRWMFIVVGRYRITPSMKHMQMSVFRKSPLGVPLFWHSWLTSLLVEWIKSFFELCTQTIMSHIVNIQDHLWDMQSMWQMKLSSFVVYCLAVVLGYSVVQALQRKCVLLTMRSLFIIIDMFKLLISVVIPLIARKKKELSPVLQGNWSFVWLVTD